MELCGAGIKFSTKKDADLQYVVKSLKNFLYTAMAESRDELAHQEFTALLTIKVELSQVEIGAICHMEPLINNLKSLFKLFTSKQETLLGDRMDKAAKIIVRTKGGFLEGDYVPYRISLNEDTLYIEPRDSVITTPVSTSDLLVALSALLRGNILNIDHQAPTNYRDQLLFEYLDRSKFGEPISFSHFHFRENEPEKWYMSPRKE